MAHNNDAFYDAVVAGAGGGAQHGWLILSTPASYTPFANNIDILATAVDLQIPTIAGGPSISQINLLQSITQSVLTARYPVPVAPATYIDIAKAIAAVYTELEKLLTNQPAVASYGVNWLVADWYIDGTVGDDANSGVVIGAPLKTGAELLRRLGPYAIWPQSVTVHVLANGMIDALVLRGLMQVAGNHLDVVGTPTVLADAGTVATYQAEDHTVPRAPQLTTTAIVDWTPYIWRRMRLTSGVSTGAVNWILTANPAGAGLATARTTRWAAVNLTSTGSIVTTITPAVGSGVIIERLPKVPAVDIDLAGPLSLANTALWPVRQLFISDIDCPQITEKASGIIAPGKTGIYGCRLTMTNCTSQPSGAAVANVLHGCLFGNDISTQALSVAFTQPVNACAVGDGITRANIGPGVNFLGNVVFQGARLFLNQQYLQASNIQFFDYTATPTDPMLHAFPGSQINCTNVSGTGNTGYGIGLNNFVQVRFAGTTNLQGTLGNGRLGTAPTITLTLPQLLQPSDYAQKGITPAMVAGTTTVTVPWYDNATQRVTVSHAAFGGTPGILSVQQISTTQFTITSSSALDTSTINWTISPLGRNIFISTT